VVAEASPFNRVLEIGIGGGEHLAFEHQRPGRQYFGIELVLDYAKVCHLNGQVPVAIGDAADLPFPSAGFDCVIAVGVLEHVEAISRVTRELKRVLCPGGSLLVIVPPNGGLTVGLVELLLTYPTMMARGINEDAKEAFGHGVRGKRSNSGAVSFELIETEASHAALG
jgi:SAM-dependent methyltransferase